MSLAAQAGAAELGLLGSQFTLDGKATFLLGISYYGGLGAPPRFVAADFRDLAAAGFNWVRVWATWESYGEAVSAVSVQGEAREPYLSRLVALAREADKRGIVVDVTLSRGEMLPDQAAHLRAVEVLCTALKGFRNVYVDLANERDIRDARYVSFEELRALRDRLKDTDPARLVTASGSDDPGRYLGEAGLDFYSPHLGREKGSALRTEESTRGILARMAELGHVAPVHYQEPFRRGYCDYEPVLEDYRTDLQGAARGRAAGWCLHNGSPRGTGNDAEARPRRSFDLRRSEGRLMRQLDGVEREVVRDARQWLAEAQGEMR
jgi:hypothetical protein